MVDISSENNEISIGVSTSDNKVNINVGEFNTDNKENINVISNSGTDEHDKLKNREMENQHPILAITGLSNKLNILDNTDTDLKNKISTEILRATTKEVEIETSLVQKENILTNYINNLSMTVDNNYTSLSDKIDTKQPIGDYATNTAVNIVSQNLTQEITNRKNSDIELQEQIIANKNNFVNYRTAENQDIIDNTIKASIPTKNSQLTNDSGFITSTDVPTKVSQLANDSDYQTSSQVMAAIAAIPHFKIKIVELLPEIGEKMILYLVRKEGEQFNIFNEYIWIEETLSFELLGSTAINLSEYYNKTETDNLLNGKVDKVIGKSLISDTEIERLSTVTNYDDTEILNNISEIDSNISDINNIIQEINSDLETKQDIISDLNSIREGASKGETALQSYTETDPIYTAEKPYLALKSELPTIPTNVSEFHNDVGYITNTVDDLVNYTDTTALTDLLSKKQDTLVNQENIKSVNNQSLLGSGNLDIDNIESITYSELVELKTSGKLKKGLFYRIIDYVTTTNGNSINSDERSISAGHKFDIIIQAIDINKLSERCFACLHDDDTYFANDNISKWQIWYDINNDINKYAWAVTNGLGKGVIYRMIDAKGNDCPYDFKNIMFYRNPDTYTDISSKLTSYDNYYYTFSYINGTTVEDWTLGTIYPKFNSNNRIGDCINLSLANDTDYQTDTTKYKKLNNSVFILTGNCMENNYFGTNSFNNTMVVSEMHSNNINSLFIDNISNCVFNQNIISNYCYKNKFLANFEENIVNNDFKLNIIEGITIYNTFNGFYSNNIKYKVSNCFFGKNIKYNTFNGNYYDYFCGSNLYNTFGNFSVSNIYGSNVSYNIFGSDARYNIVENNVCYIKTADSASTNEYGLINSTIKSGLCGKNSTNLLDLTELPTNTDYSITIQKDINNKVIATWNDNGNIRGKYKKSITDIEWFDILFDFYTKEEINDLIYGYLKLNNVTYSELVDLKTNNQLETGALYRITDYVTTTNGNSADSAEPSRSAGHPFDIIVRALGPSDLSEICNCALHEGDTYFANQNLGAWQVWYDINNDDTKYDWAVTDGTGKGVIYRMIDEYQNDFPYDFKNIQFYRDKTLAKYSTLSAGMKAEDGYYYTITDTTGTNNSDLSLLNGYVFNNKMNAHIPNKKVLNNNVSIQYNTKAFIGNNFDADCYNNTFGYQIRGNNIGDNFVGNVIDSYVIANSINSYFQNNIIGSRFRMNTISVWFTNNTIGDYFDYNNIGSYFQNNTIEYGYIYECHIRRYFQNNTIKGKYFQGCNVGESCKYNTFSGTKYAPYLCNIGSNFQYNTIGNDIGSIIFENDIKYVNVPAGLYQTTIKSKLQGSSATNLLNLSGLATYASYNQTIEKDVNGRVLATWSDFGVTKGKYKESVTATEWNDITLDYYTKTEIDEQIGDISSVLDSINGEVQ